MIRLLPKTFSNCNQVVSSILKNFDRVLWKDLMSDMRYYAVKHFFRINKQKKKTEKNAGFCKRKTFNKKVSLIKV
jgi:hypothetical protein